MSTATQTRTVLPKPVLAIALDRGLVKGGLLTEACWAILRAKPWMALHLIWWYCQGRPYLWERVAECTPLGIELLPFRQELLVLAARERHHRQVVLIADCPASIVRRIVEQLGCFSEVCASTARLSELSGPAGFEYIGEVDAPSWLSSIWRELRPHQWTKNLLVLVAVGTSHRYKEWTSLAHAVAAALLFCLASSSVYLANDLIDLEADRAHPTKKKRPLAHGDLPLWAAVLLAILFAGAAVLWSALLDRRLALVVGLYMLASSLYSIWIKEFLVVDVVMLACLYVLRVVAGGFAIGIWLSFWTFAFSLFFFFSLALMKRYSELRIRQELDTPQSNRRAYRTSDAVQLNLLGVASSLVSVCIVGLYIDGADVKRLYTNPAILWFLCPLLLYWCGRQWILAGRGEMSEDPVAFALHDWRSYVIGILAAITVIVAT